MSTARASQAPTTSNFQVASVISQFAVASVTMVAGNKAAVTHFPLASTLVIIQALGSVAILLAFFRKEVGAALTFPPALLREWLPISVLFTVMLFTSMKSFVYSGVSTILILRNVGAIVTTVVEYFVRGTTANMGTYASEVVIVIGAVLYTGGAVDISPQGLFWIFSNIAAQVAYGVLLKMKMDTSNELQSLTKFGMSFLNNALAVPMVAVVMVVQKEHEVLVDAVGKTTMTGWALVLLTCVFGFIISTAGFGLQKLVSAATFLVINNLTKFVNILLGILVFGDKVDGWRAISGCVLALGAGVWYSYEQILLRQAADIEKAQASAAAATMATTKNQKKKK